MLALVAYIIVALCFIVGFVMCSMISNKTYKFLSLTFLGLVFVVVVAVMMVKVSGQPDVISLFNALSK